jgi:DNA-directed RNA polymerase specialized sigma24 family protein
VGRPAALRRVVFLGVRDRPEACEWSGTDGKEAGSAVAGPADERKAAAVLGEREEAAGKAPAVDQHAHRVQPENESDFVLGRPVPRADVLANIKPALADETRRLQETLERRIADRELLAQLAAQDFTGRRYDRFEHELAAYGMSVLRGWMHSGYVFKLAAGRGFAMHPTEAELEELFRDSVAREELAIMTVAKALPRFKEHALVGGGWRFEGGASLPTYFMGACLYVFPNEFRARRVQQRKWTRAHRIEATNLEPIANPVSNPAVITTGNLRVCEDLEQLDERTRAIVALTVDGYSQEEIVELLGEQSVRAVEAVLYRWRTKEKTHVHRGGDQDG